MHWNETSTRIDLSCECGAYFQYRADVPCSGSVRCTACDQVWILSPVLEMRRARAGNPMDAFRIEAAEWPSNADD